jgi:predicted CxxxxCH...CXXCH cytochrome family protein
MNYARRVFMAKKHRGMPAILSAVVVCLLMLITAVSSVDADVINHNSDAFNNPATTKWGGKWGVGGGKYGPISCDTCHQPRAGNIKGVKTHFDTYSAAQGVNFPNGATGTVVFRTISSMGNDADNHTTSKRVCEVCHSVTSYHRYNTTGQTDKAHYNKQDCASCHAHTAGFKASCTSCHGDSVLGYVWPVSNAYPNYSGSHRRHNIGNYSFSCDTCHPAPVGSGGHDNVYPPGTPPDSHDVAFSGLFAGGTYAPSPAFTCSNTYCHNLSGTGQSTTWTWRNSNPTITCASCHGDKTDTVGHLSGKHTEHVNNDAVLGTNLSFNCIDCHAKTVSSNTVIGNYAKHVDGYSDYSGVYAGKVTGGYDNATNNCQNFYCHSNGNPNAITYVNPASWTAGTLGCNGCHGTSNANTGDPDYVNGGAGTATSNSHSKHVGGAGMTDTTGCANCHRKTVDLTTAGKLRNFSSTHLNKTVEVNFREIATGVFGNYSTVRQTCSNTYCHGVSPSPRWGAASLNCNGCHSATGADTYWTANSAHRQHVQSGIGTNFSAYSSPASNRSTATLYGFTCASCHNPKAGAVHSGGPANTNGAGQVFFGYTSNNRKGNPYNYATTQGADNGFNWTNGGSTSCTNTYCHSDGRGNAPKKTAFTWASGDSTLNCAGCHGGYKGAGVFPQISSLAHQHHINNAGYSDYLCSKCHNSTTTDGTTIANKAKHINKTKEVVFDTPAYGNYSSTPMSCASVTACHGRTKPLWNQTSTGCNFCHPYDANSWSGTGNRWSGNQISPVAQAFGAHSSHIGHIKNRVGITGALNLLSTFDGAGSDADKVCGSCHTITKSNHLNSTRSINFGDKRYKTGGASGFNFVFGSSSSIYNGNSGTSSSANPKSCSNISCHYSTTPVWSSY